MTTKSSRQEEQSKKLWVCLLVTGALLILQGYSSPRSKVQNPGQFIATGKKMRETNPSTSTNNDQKDKPAIIMLVPNFTEDLENVEYAIKSMDRHFDDNQTTPILVFHEGNLPLEYPSRVAKWTRRTLHWSIVDFQNFPKGFDPESNASKMEHFKRSRWGYQQMCRFWISGLWEHEAIRNYTTLLRLDTDSCFVEKNMNISLPYLSQKYVYTSQLRYFGDSLDVAEGLFDVAMEFVERHNISIQNDWLWRLAGLHTRPNVRKKLVPIFYNNIELDRIDFFQRPMVRAFHHRITEEPPYGVLSRRWGDAPVRVLTMAIFAKPEEIMYFRVISGYVHGTRCRSVNISRC